MPTVALLDAALDVAKRLGYAVRHECLGGSGGGGCELSGRKLLFLDLDPRPGRPTRAGHSPHYVKCPIAALPMAHGLRDCYAAEECVRGEGLGIGDLGI